MTDKNDAADVPRARFTELYCLCAAGVGDEPIPLYDSETGAPSVYVSRGAADAECALLNNSTDGGYFVIAFTPDDVRDGAL